MRNKSKCNAIKPNLLSKAYAYIINNICKAQRVKEKICKHKVTPKSVIEEETEVLGEKSLCNPLSWNDPLVNKVGVQGYQKDSPSLIYPMYLNLPSYSSQQTSPSHVFTSYLDPAICSKLHPPTNGFFQCFPHTPKLLSTLRLGKVSVWAKNLSKICNWRGRSRGKLREIV